MSRARGEERLRALLASGRLATAPGVADVLSARIAARAGHDALYLGGNAMALGVGKGQPFLTLTETVELTARVARSVDQPLVVDAGAGFGNLAHLHGAVRELEGAGAAAIHIDDQPYPKRAAYHRGQGTLVSTEAMAARIRTACAARSDMLIFARSDALRVSGSVDEAIARCRAYAETGADGLILLDLDPERVRLVRAAVPQLPLIWIGGVVPPIPSVTELEAAGFALALYPFNGVAAVTAVLADLWQGLKATGRIGQPDELLVRARKETLEIVDMPSFWAIEEDEE
ncbi:isocitrate lyase/PEP mutase family protein [Sphingobium sp.]|uniref:isocitrate lyase/PEP mutase family protein n=1 Tax=Sphingobium sp. TaxID=1912891 RepID=UPI0028BF1910|nr:isocitrate lyase/PEP mutase family protein [Sphingobium sp.]